MDDFEKVKQEITIGQVIDHYGSNVIKKAVEPSVCCNHGDCMKLVGDGGFKCYSCSAKGSIIDLVMAREGFSGDTGKGEALKLLANIGGIELTPPSGSDSRKQKKGGKDPVEGGRGKALRLSVEYCCGVLENGGADKGKQYFITDRGHSQATMAAMQMGWTDGKLCSWLKKEHGFSNSDLFSYGLGQDKDTKGDSLSRMRDFFWKKNMAVFPIFDHAGKVISLTVKDPDKDKDKKFKAQMLGGHGKAWLLNFQELGRHSEHFIVEGQNDIASFFDIDMKNVSGTCGGPGNDQVKQIKNHCAGKTVYLFFDPDLGHDPRKSTGGPQHTRILYKGLKDSNVEVKIIYLPGCNDDPDEFIQGIIKEKDKVAAKKSIMELKGKALTPLQWEIEQIARIDDNAGDAKMVAINRGLPVSIASLEFLADREIYIDKLAKAIGISVKAVEGMIETSDTLKDKLKSRFSGGVKHADPLELTIAIYEWFEMSSGKWFTTIDDGKQRLHFHGTTYEIGDNHPFNALMLRLTGLLKPEKPGSTVWYALATMCEQKGEKVEMMSWTYTCRDSDTIYYNLNLPHQKIIKITAGQEPATLQNGTNENAILLSTSPQIREVVYIPVTGEAEGIRAIKSLCMDTMPCEPAQRYFVACWVLSAFMMGYQSDRGLIQVIGGSGIGKSKVAERWSELFYGEVYIGKGTGAASKRIATQNPILFLDNIENRDINKGVLELLLFMANSAQAPKASQQSETAVIYQKLNCQGMITSIEPFPGKYSELINRTFPIICENRYRITGGYVHTECLGNISKKRPMMISSILSMLSNEVLPNLTGRVFWSEMINREFPGHNKERNNEHLTTMAIILEALLKYIPVNEKHTPQQDAILIVKKWIEYQNAQAMETAITSNILLTIMDGIQKEICMTIRRMGDKLHYEENRFFKKSVYDRDIKVKVFEDEQYFETFYLTEAFDYEGEDEDLFMERVQRFEIILSSKELHTLFNRTGKNQMIRNPFETPAALGARISNDREVMEKGSWRYLLGKNKSLAPYFAKISDNKWRFSKEIRAIE